MSEVSGGRFVDEEEPEHRRPRGHPGGDGAVRPDRRAVGGAGAVAAPTVPVGSSVVVGQAAADRRDRWRVRVGAPWRDIPATCGSWSAAYGLFRRRRRVGVWQVVLTASQAGADAVGQLTRDVGVDSTSVRAHRHAAGARKGGIRGPSRRAGSRPSPTITRWAVPAAGGPRNCIWAASRARSRCRSC
ncbi:transposase [Actinokineospora sp. NBRC 105648]|uniref:transposase n=1 Tax=Actinokineospora sp. NBRC 105648 TaxID=3032206 RepID=UPI00331F4335